MDSGFFQVKDRMMKQDIDLSKFKDQEKVRGYGQDRNYSTKLMMKEHHSNIAVSIQEVINSQKSNGSWDNETLFKRLFP